MTILNSPTSSEIIITLIISTIIPLTIIHLISKKWKAKDKLLRMLITLAIFFILFIIIAINIIKFFIIF